mmetsp:Transcript_18577/g.62269  ORF Transcript_18577/g.62269 Transcript_18577/m.62269 type:complete len:81 (+) Transcript_18577:729-971(+)
MAQVLGLKTLIESLVHAAQCALPVGLHPRGERHRGPADVCFGPPAQPVLRPGHGHARRARGRALQRHARLECLRSASNPS